MKFIHFCQSQSRLRHRLLPRILPLCGVLTLGFVASCGYHLKTSETALTTRYQIYKVYIAPIKNSTPIEGIDQILYHEVIKSLSLSRHVQMVNRLDEADAVLNGEIKQADRFFNLGTSSDNIYPNDVKTQQMQVATEFNAVMICYFEIQEQAAHAQQRKVATPLKLSSDFSRSKLFPAHYQKGIYGHTSELLNEGDFKRSIQEISASIATDMNEAFFSSTLLTAPEKQR
jgi:hypothetical protein